MVIAEIMDKPLVKVTVSNSNSSSEGAEDSEYEAEVSDESDEASDENNESDDLIMKNEGWADSVAKILGSSKPKNKKTLVLSRAKKLADVIKKETKEKPSFEVVGENEESPEIKPVTSKDDDTTEPPIKKKKYDKSSVRVKPNILEKDRERLLAKIATKGVVQLFNAVRNQQKTFEKELSKDVPEGKKDKVFKKFNKRAFLDTLMGQSKSVLVEEQTKPLKNELKTEETPRWNALRDDFMMGAKLKDWDKESVDE